MKLFLSLQSFTCHIVNMRVQKYVFTHVVIKIKIFHSCRTRVVRIALVSHSCRLCSTRVGLGSHSCRSCLTRVAGVALVLHSCCSCRTRVPRIPHSCCKFGQIFNGNLFDTFAVATSVVNRKMTVRFQRVIFRIKKRFDQQSCQVQVTQTAADYSRSCLFKEAQKLSLRFQ